MRITKETFLSNLIGQRTYDDLNSYAKFIVPIGTLILLVLWGLSLLVHWGFISSLLNFLTGYNLLFLAYIILLIIYLDFSIAVDIPKYESKINKKIEKYICGLILLIIIVHKIIIIGLGISAMYFSNKYKSHYAFECNTFLVDEKKGIYHLDGFNDNCEEIEDQSDLVKMKGYQIEQETDYTFCECCESWEEDALGSYEFDRYYKK